MRCAPSTRRPCVFDRVVAAAAPSKRLVGVRASLSAAARAPKTAAPPPARRRRRLRGAARAGAADVRGFEQRAPAWAARTPGARRPRAPRPSSGTAGSRRRLAVEFLATTRSSSARSRHGRVRRAPLGAFDVCFVDEAAWAVEAETLVAIAALRADGRLRLIGGQNQLPRR